MKPFNLEVYLANPSRRVVTRDGRSVRIICTDRRDADYPIVALTESTSGEVVNFYTKDGKYFIKDTSNCDLFFTPEKHEGWINLYRGSESGELYCGNVYESEELAKDAGEGSIATIKIEWEE